MKRKTRAVPWFSCAECAKVHTTSAVGGEMARERKRCPSCRRSVCADRMREHLEHCSPEYLRRTPGTS
jgi:hypothetical protein